MADLTFVMYLGITVSKDYKLVYVTSSVDNNLHIFTRNTSNELVEKETVSIDAGTSSLLFYYSFVRFITYLCYRSRQH